MRAERQQATAGGIDVHRRPGSRPGPQHGTGRCGPGSHFALGAALLGFFVITLDALIVSVALPSVGKDLGGGITGLQWVVDGSTLMLAALLLSAGSISDRVGAKQACGLGMVVFLLASAACGLAPILPFLVIARFVQGAGVSFISAAATRKFGAKPTMITGQLITGVGLLVLCLLPTTTPVWAVAVLLMPVSFGGTLAVAVYGTLVAGSFASGMRIGLVAGAVMLAAAAAVELGRIRRR